MNDSSFFILKGIIQQNNQKEILVSLAYRLNQKKILYLNNIPTETVTSWIGTVPVVLIHHSDILSFQKGTFLRRKILDKFACQIQEGYLNTLIRYKKILAHRNKLLQQIDNSKNTLQSYLEPWNKQLSHTGFRLTKWRKLLCIQLQQTISKIQYRFYSNNQSHIALNYQASLDTKTEYQFYEALIKNQANDIKTRTTLLGPHQDDLSFHCYNYPFKQHTSQDQHPLFICILKMAQALLLMKKKQKYPILLIDDMFNDLDPQNMESILYFVQSYDGQIFITSQKKEQLLPLFAAYDKIFCHYHLE